MTSDAGRGHLMRYVEQPEPSEPPALHPTAMVKASGWIADANGHIVHFSGTRRASVAVVRRMENEAETAVLAQRETEHYDAVRCRRARVLNFVPIFFRGLGELF